MKNNLFAVVICLVIISCSSRAKETPQVTIKEKKITDTSLINLTMADAKTILSRTQVPVLCYHHIRNFRTGESERMKEYEVTPESFQQQMQILADSGYHTITPSQLFEYLAHGAALPSKPVMLSYDDTDLEQFTIAYTEMKKHGFKGVYFIMTISIGRPRYMSREQIKQLSDEGNEICCHTWDHHMVTKYKDSDWDTQLVKPRRKLEEITGKHIEYFAYPFGLWNAAAIPELKNRDYKLAFILSTKRDSSEPLYTVRRMIVPGQWTPTGMLKAMKSTFHLN